MNAPVPCPALALPSTLPQEDGLDLLARSIRDNRFLPQPPAGSIFVGDGDFRAIGAEFLQHFVRLGGLGPDDRVLDIGCGIGRMALPLSQYLTPGTPYQGIDPVREGIAWCVQNISPVYPEFRFSHCDIAHPLYNPGGALDGAALVLPFGGGTFDFTIMTSVLTHLPPAHVRVYAREVARLLAPGGRLFATAFLVEPDDIERAQARPHFLPGEEPGTFIADPTAPLGAIGFPPDFVTGALVDAGLAIERVSLGHWRGLPAGHYQDIIVARKPGKRAP
jgi:SAM-dependent methyltransferase